MVQNMRLFGISVEVQSVNIRSKPLKTSITYSGRKVGEFRRTMSGIERQLVEYVDDEINELPIEERDIALKKGLWRRHSQKAARAIAAIEACDDSLFGCLFDSKSYFSARLRTAEQLSYIAQTVALMNGFGLQNGHLQTFCHRAIHLLNECNPELSVSGEKTQVGSDALRIIHLIARGSPTTEMVDRVERAFDIVLQQHTREPGSEWEARDWRYHPYNIPKWFEPESHMDELRQYQRSLS